MAWTGEIETRIPLITLAAVSASLIAYAAPQLADLLVYDRQHVLDGQLWRLLTAPFVHFSASHLAWNILVFAAAGCVTELAGHQRFGFVCILAIAVPGLVFLATKPDLTRYGGLSALATGTVAYLSLCQAQQARRDRWLWIALFALLPVKILVEAGIEAPIFAQASSTAFRVLPSAHAVGVAAAAVVFVSKGRRAPKCH